MVPYRDRKELIGRILPDGAECSVCHQADRWEPYDAIVDVWFESGVSYSVVRPAGVPSDQADLYLEGHDQYRGWFHSSLLIAVNDKNRAPYRTVLTHGFTLDAEGRKMSKSKGNVISPQEVIQGRGAEILRLWVSMTNYLDDMRLSEEILKQNVEAYRKIRNTSRFLLGNLHDFRPDRDRVPFDAMEEIDRWALLQLRRVSSRVRVGYEQFEFHTVYHTLQDFCAVTMSSIYLDILKDRLYTSSRAAAPRRSAQTALWRIAETVCRLMAPILCFTSEEIWGELGKLKSRGRSIHLAEFLSAADIPEDADLEERWKYLLSLRQEVQKALELAREEKLIGNSLEGKVILSAGPPLAELLKRYHSQLPMIFIVSQVDLRIAATGGRSKGNASPRIEIQRAEGEKCERCWNYSTDVGTEGEFPRLCGRCIRPVREYLNELSHESR